MVFKDRAQAASLLAEKLKGYQQEKPLVLAIPRGAVIMGKIIAEKLHGDLDVALVHKIGAPWNLELAIGAVSEFGDIYLNEISKAHSISKNYIDQHIKTEIEHLKNRRHVFTPNREPISPRERTVIIVDDGIATGSTMLAAILCIKGRQPSKIVVATAVASHDAVERIKLDVDEVVTLDIPEPFYAVSQFFETFPQVTDDEVIEGLKQAA